MQPIKVYNGTPGTGPNPFKVILVLAELDLPYEIEWVDYGSIKSEPYISLNPNGRLPAVIDPNTGVTLFESGAIINYLIETYDSGPQQRRLSYGDDQISAKWLAQSWLMFQMSGQGPMFGQKMWFTHFHVEHDVRSALDRYAGEVKRILGVIDTTLRKQRETSKVRPEEPVWLVGNRCTYADISFVPWNVILLTNLFPEGLFDVRRDFPEFYKWHGHVTARPAVKEAVKSREEWIRTMKNSALNALAQQADARKLA